MARAKIENFDEDVVALAAFAKALGHPARVEILRFLQARGEVPCMEIVDHLPLSQPACSRHINELLRAGLLSSRTVRTRILFKIRKKTLDQFRTMMKTVIHQKVSLSNQASDKRK